MDIFEVLDQVRARLQQQGRVTYRILKRQFALDDEALEDLKEQLIDAEELSIDKNGKMLVWTGEQPVVSSQHSVVSSPLILSRSPMAEPGQENGSPRPPRSRLQLVHRRV